MLTGFWGFICRLCLICNAVSVRVCVAQLLSHSSTFCLTSYFLSFPPSTTTLPTTFLPLLAVVALAMSDRPPLQSRRRNAEPAGALWGYFFSHLWSPGDIFFNLWSSGVVRVVGFTGFFFLTIFFQFVGGVLVLGYCAVCFAWFGVGWLLICIYFFFVCL